MHYRLGLILSCGIITCFCRAAWADIFLLKNNRVLVGSIQEADGGTLAILRRYDVVEIPATDVYSVYTQHNIDPQLLTALETLLDSSVVFPARKIPEFGGNPSQNEQAQNHYRRARELAAQGGLGQASLALLRAAELDTNFADPCVALGEILLELGNTAAARVQWTQALARQSDHPFVRSRLQTFLANDTADTVDLSRLLQSYQGAELYYQLAHWHLSHQQLEHAQSYWNSYLASDPQLSAVFNQEGQSLQQAVALQAAGRHAQSLAVLSQVAQCNPLLRDEVDSRRAAIYADKFQQLLLMGACDEARSWLGSWAEALTLSEAVVAQRTVEIWEQQSELWRAGGNLPKAIAALEQAQRELPAYSAHFLEKIAATYADHATELSTAGAHAAALEVWKQFAECQPAQTQFVAQQLAREHVALAQSMVDSQPAIVLQHAQYALELDPSGREKLADWLSPVLTAHADQAVSHHDYFTAATTLGALLPFDSSPARLDRVVEYAHAYVAWTGKDNPQWQRRAWEELALKIPFEAFQIVAQETITRISRQLLNPLADFFPMQADQWWKYAGDDFTLVVALDAVDYQRDRIIGRYRLTRSAHAQASLTYETLTFMADTVSHGPAAPADVVAVYPLQVGRTWQAVATGVALERRCQSLDETVILYDQTYEHCAHLQIFAVMAEPAGGRQLVGEEWFAPAIGMIKKVVTGHPEQTIQLLSYSHATPQE